MKKAEIKRLILEEELTITDVIDVVIELNGLVGVGLISLANEIAKYIQEKLK